MKLSEVDIGTFDFVIPSCVIMVAVFISFVFKAMGVEVSLSFCRGSRVEGRGFQVEGEGSMSRVEGRGSRVTFFFSNFFFLEKVTIDALK